MISSPKALMYYYQKPDITYNEYHKQCNARLVAVDDIFEDILGKNYVWWTANSSNTTTEANKKETNEGEKLVK